MSDEIRANYDELKTVVSRFMAQSQSIEELQQKVRSAMEKLENGGWIGLGADAFFAEMQGVVLPAVDRLIKALADASRTTGEIATTIQNAEQEASGLFRS
jgi:WXG100 family type VII secretion target